MGTEVSMFVLLISSVAQSDYTTMPRKIHRRPHSTRDLPALSRLYREHMAALLCALVDMADGQLDWRTENGRAMIARVHELRAECGRLSYLILARSGYSVKAWKKLRGG